MRFDLLSQNLPGTAGRAAFDRAARVKLLAEMAAALLAGRKPSRASALFVGGALSAWLENGGSLERQYFRVSARRGSHHTAAALWRAHRDERQGDADRDIVMPSSQETT